MALGLAAAAAQPGAGVRAPAVMSGALTPATQSWAAAPVSSAAPSQPSQTTVSRYRPDEVLLAFRAGVSASHQRAIERAAGGAGARRLGPAIKPAGRGRVRGAEYLAPLELRVSGSKLDVALARLRSDPAVAYAEPNYLQHGDATPNDPSFSLQWGDSNTGQAIPTQNQEEVLGAPANGLAGADDRALRAWSVSTGSRSIVIGDTDTGVDYQHPDLAANIWTNPGGIGGCAQGTHGYNVPGKNCNPMDEDTTYNGHGTHVAGILGAVGNNSVGIAGMNWQTAILPLKWMQNASSGETSALIEALQWLVAAKQAGVNVRVVNDSDTFFGTARSEALSNEIETLGANNILFVASAGNTGNNNDEVAVQRYPCSYDRANEICVTATNSNDQIPSWANYGPHTVDLAAPGVSIYSTLREGKYGYLTGGSMAAPQVSGAAALILSVSPSLSATALKADILEHVDKLASLEGKVITGGRLDVCKAMPGCTESPAPPTNVKPPTITGVAQQGQTLTAVHGEWTNGPTSFTYQWLQCNSLGSSCLPISGATGQTYVPITGDVGHTIAVQETAHNAGGASSPATSSATAIVTSGTPSPPTNVSPPKITGTAQQGKTLTEIHGEWTNGPTGFTYQWLQCSSRGKTCVAIAGAAGQTHVPVAGDVGHTIKIQETAHNAGGASSPATSSATAIVSPGTLSPPTNVKPPTITGVAQQGQTLTEVHGEWTNGPTSFTYQWLQCESSGSGCKAISAATAQTYVPVMGDVGHTIEVQETASNEGGASSPASSAAAAVVAKGSATSTFGKTSVGASTDSFGFERKRVNRYTLPEAGSVTKLTVYLAPTSTSGQQVLKGLIYSDSAGTPAALLGVSEQLTFTSASVAGWYELHFSSPVSLATGNYWIGVITGPTNHVASFRYDTVAGARDYNANAYASGPTNPFGAVTSDGEQMSLYATY
jgi:subtilisin family serine protease